jgi:zinc/manganese transport system substrate-binding protein
MEAKLEGITTKLDAIKAAHHSEAVAVTEPVPLYLLETAGLQNKTPEAFSLDAPMTSGGLSAP